MTHHDPTVTAAVVSVIGTGVVAIAGYVTTMRSTRRALRSAEATAQKTLNSSEASVRQTITGEREHRLWERRTDTYLEVIAFVTHRSAVREHQARMYRLDENSERAIEDSLNSYSLNGTWFDLEARLRAFATEPVTNATLVANAAHQAYLDAAVAVQTAAAGQSSVAAFKARDEAVKVASAKDALLCELIRGEIQQAR